MQRRSDAGNAMLPTKPLGKTGLQVTVLGAGCAFLGRRSDGSIDHDLGVGAIVAALDAGMRLVDTAAMYGSGASERMVGEALRQRPDLADSVIVETKVRDVRDFGYTADETRRSVETSLTRLGLDHLDVVYVHDPPAAILSRVMANDGALGALRQLQSEKVVGHIGIASNNPWDNAPYVETGAFEAAVVPDAFSLISQVARERIFPAAERYGMGVVVATPLERGLLATGTTALRTEDHVNRTFSPQVFAHVARIEALCAEYGVSLLAAALQYVVRPSVVSTTVPGLRSPDQASANAAALREPIPEGFWQALDPLVADYKTAIPPE
ncbi:MAG: aldo/keto reductase [Chloroflexi bacterium]|nr:aldo/keto reductase [Chloroflexota bacterium]